MKFEAHLSSFIRHNLVSSEITLVTDKKLVDIVTGITVNFVQPLLYIVEALLISYIIYNLPRKASDYLIGLSILISTILIGI